MFEIIKTGSGFELLLNGRLILRHSASAPALFWGRGEADISCHTGNFDITDHSEYFPAVFEGINGNEIAFSGLKLTVSTENGLARLSCSCADSEVNRLHIRYYAEADEHVMGGGEQYSALDLRGRSWPIWTREQGVGRNKDTEITKLADAWDGGGGDYHTTYFPQPTYVSSRMYFMHMDGYTYSELDFRAEAYHEVTVWANSFSAVFYAADNYKALVSKLSEYLGRQPMLPDWAMSGIWLGVQGGSEKVLEIERRCKAAGVDVSGVWIQDWVGKRITSFGKRLQWDWWWHPEVYPKLDEIIANDEAKWLVYFNPNLVEGGKLFEICREKGYFIKNADGDDYLTDFGEYNCGHIDFSNPEAFLWYKEHIKSEIIKTGVRGWMADFGEYLPHDVVCFNGETGMTAHNAYPVWWARCCREAIDELGLTGDCVFFMRAGGTGSQRYSTFLWAGDQCVDWSEDDGLPSVITAALSSGISGFGLSGCDAGGYTTLFHLKRDEELLLRWLEMAVFSPIVRTHEGNRPETNVQLYSNDEILHKAARLSRLHTALLPYMRECVRINAQTGIPVQRPLFFELPEDARAYSHLLHEYMLGDDVVVAPIVEQGAVSREVLLPCGEWIELWTGAERSGEICVDAPLGYIPVFYRKDSRFTELFKEISGQFA